MDPAVRRRRIVLTVALTVLVVGGIALYVALQDWPEWSVDRDHAVPLYTSTVRGYLELPIAPVAA